MVRLTVDAAAASHTFDEKSLRLNLSRQQATKEGNPRRRAMGTVR